MKKALCLIMAVALTVCMIPAFASAATTYTGGYIEYRNYIPEGDDGGFFTSEDNREKVGSCYFYTTEDYDENYICNLYCSKSKTGKAVKVAKAKYPNTLGATVVTTGKYVYYTICNYDTNKCKIYRVGTDGKGNKLLKTVSGAYNAALLRAYNGYLYFYKEAESQNDMYGVGGPTVGTLNKMSLKTNKTSKCLSNVAFSYKYSGTLPGTSSDRYIYCTNADKNVLYVYDCKENKKIRTVNVGAKVEGAIIQDYCKVATAEGKQLEILVDVEEAGGYGLHDLYAYKTSVTGKNLELDKKLSISGYNYFGSRLVDGMICFPEASSNDEVSSPQDCTYLLYDVAKGTITECENMGRYIQLYG